MEGVNAVLDLNLKKLTILLMSILAFTILFVFVSRDFTQWRDLSSFAEWTKTGMHASDGNASCLSRTHQQLYRTFKLAPASPKLVESWQRYVQMHRSCAGGRNWTEMFAGSSSNSSSSAGSQECKYLFYVETGEGLGNRFLSLMSAMVYALLTDRVLMIDSRGSLSGILCEPFVGSSWLLPHDFPYEQMDAAPPLGVGIEKRFTGVPVLHLKLFHIQSGGDQSFFCDEYQEPLNSVKLLAWSSNQYFVTSFFTVPVLWKKLVALFPGPRLDVAAQIAQLVILPANDVWSLIVRFHDGYLACSKSKVGVQIRPHGRQDITAFDPVVSQIVFDCLMHHQLLPRTIASSGNSTTLDLDSESRQRHEADVSVLVASLQGKYYESLRDAFLDHEIEGGKVVSVHSLSHEGFEQHTLHQARLALAEMWLLSFSDRIVTSEYSTFGYIAHGVAGLRPRFLRVKGDGDGCYLSQSTEPCTQFPQKPTCASANNLTQHEEWIRRNIRACQDHPVGFQLVN